MIRMSDEVTGEQVSKVLAKYLRDYLEDNHKTALLVAAMALKQAFPCTSQSGNQQ